MKSPREFGSNENALLSYRRSTHSWVESFLPLWNQCNFFFFFFPFKCFQISLKLEKPWDYERKIKMEMTATLNRGCISVLRRKRRQIGWYQLIRPLLWTAYQIQRENPVSKGAILFIILTTLNKSLHLWKYIHLHLPKPLPSRAPVAQSVSARYL